MEAETAEILDARRARVKSAEDLGGPWRGMGVPPSSDPDADRPWRNRISGGRALYLGGGSEDGSGPGRSVPSDPEKAPALARLRFAVPEDGDYYLFLKNDSWCCGCFSMGFRIDRDLAKKAEGNWDRGDWNWKPLRFREMEINAGHEVCRCEIPEPFRLGAGKHTLDILWADAPCGGLVIDQLVVTRQFRQFRGRNGTPEGRR